MSTSGSRRLSLRIFARTEKAPAKNPGGQPLRKRSQPRETSDELSQKPGRPDFQSAKIHPNLKGGTGSVPSDTRRQA